MNNLSFEMDFKWREKKMKKINAILIVALTLLLMAASVMAQKTRVPAARDYFPMRVGDSWKYRNMTGDAEYTMKVVSAEKQADGNMLYMVERLAGVKVHTWYSKPNGWVLLHRESYPEHEGLEIKHAPAKQFLKNPLVAGAKWNWSGKNVTQSEMTEETQVIGPETVTVPAGTFRAIKMVSKVAEGPALKTITTWYADGVGMVKTETDGGQIKYGFELVDYSFKKAGPKK
jgi:hypothetical protein